MNKTATRIAAAFALVVCATTASAQRLDCELRYTMSGWSLFYKTAKGTGTIRCNNGQRMTVDIRVKGGGLTFGKQKIYNGRGEFSGVYDIDDLLGIYATGGAHAGVGKSSAAGVMTKGDVSLALAGTGEGVNIGVDFGKFIITH